jgi:hypothetical protein
VATSKPNLVTTSKPILWQLQNPPCDNLKTQSCHKLKTLSCKAHSSSAPWTHTYLTFGTPGRIRQMPRTMQSIITPAIEASYNFSTMTCRWMIIQKFHLVEKMSEHWKTLDASHSLPLIHKPYKPALTRCLWGYV